MAELTDNSGRDITEEVTKRVDAILDEGLRAVGTWWTSDYLCLELGPSRTEEVPYGHGIEAMVEVVLPHPEFDPETFGVERPMREGPGEMSEVAAAFEQVVADALGVDPVPLEYRGRVATTTGKTGVFTATFEAPEEKKADTDSK